MLKDIDFPEMKNVSIAIIPKGDDYWEVCVINDGQKKLENVLISSKGYGKLEGKEVTTSAIRQNLGSIDSKEWKTIESLNSELSKLNNEFWLSFYIDDKLYDKKFVFTSESISEQHVTHIPAIDCKGILHS